MIAALFLDYDTYVPFAVNNMWARYLLVYLFAVSDDNYDDDDTVSSSSRSSRSGT